MELASLAKPQLIFSDFEARSRDGALRGLTERICRVLGLTDPDVVLSALREREELGSTALGDGLAVPHGRIRGLRDIVLAVAVSRRGVDYGAEDGRPVRVFFVLLSPQESAGRHLKALAAVSEWWIDHGGRKRLLKARKPQEIYELLCADERV